MPFVVYKFGDFSLGSSGMVRHPFRHLREMTDHRAFGRNGIDEPIERNQAGVLALIAPAFNPQRF